MHENHYMKDLDYESLTGDPLFKPSFPEDGIGFLYDYQDWVDEVSSDRVTELGLIYASLGLSGETGEVLEEAYALASKTGRIAEKTKKIVRDKEGIPDHEDIEAIALELGDVLWYVTKMCNVLGLELERVFIANQEKINHRRIHGK